MAARKYAIFRLRKSDQKRWLIGCCLLLILASVPGYGQIVLMGNIKDAKSHEAIPFASASIVGKNVGDITDSSGFFKIETDIRQGTLLFSATGYETKELPFSGSKYFDIDLTLKKAVLKEVVIKAKHGHYRNKGNPAVALIRQVIAHKKENQLTNFQHAQYRQYEKTMMAFENPGTLIKHNFLTKKYQFVFNNIDSTTIVGAKLLPLYLQENIYKKYYQKSPKKKKSVLVATKKVALSKKYVNNASLGKALAYLYQDLDLYQNNIYILTNSFLSPISKLAPQFYRYFITDTTINPDGTKVVRLSFEPRNRHDLLFYGTLYIALNGHYSITKASIGLSKFANINWINSLHAMLKYAPNHSGKYYLQESKIGIEFGVGALVKQAVYGERTIIKSDFNSEVPIPAGIFKQKTPLITPDSVQKTNAYWLQHRPESLSNTEKQIYANIDSLNHTPSFNRLVSWIAFIAGGYKYLGPVAIGPWGTFYSYNPVEGLKLRIGGRTTDEFSKRLYFSGSLGYGFHDKKIKYFASGAYSFNKQNVFYGYPQHYIKVTALEDSRIPGRRFSFQDEGNIFLSIKRGENDRYFYNQLFQIDYVNELIPHLRFDLQYQHWIQEAAGGLYFVTDGQGGADTINSLTTSGPGLEIRWAPHEKFLNGRGDNQGNTRASIPSKYPIIDLNITTGIKGLYDGNYNFQKYVLNVSKRFYFSKLGYADVSLEGGYLNGKVPYPLLFIPRANQSYNYQISAFNLMNFLEFISSRYASVKVDYHMKGLILNNLPGLRWLRLRGVAGFRAIYGSLDSENKNEILALPTDSKGQQVTFPFGNEPYMEFNVGIENIFNIIRIDYVQRLNYLNHPGVSSSGFRISINVTF